MTNKEIDSVTGVETTGHVWDGDLQELNKPLPRWWLYTFYACIVWAIGYWIVYPAWPTLNGYTKGYLGYSQRGEVDRQVADAKVAQSNIPRSDRRNAARRHRDEPGANAVRDRGRSCRVRRQLRPCHGTRRAGRRRLSRTSTTTTGCGAAARRRSSSTITLRHPLRPRRDARTADAALRPRRHPRADRDR